MSGTVTVPPADAGARAVSELVARATATGATPAALLADVVRSLIEHRSLPVDPSVLRLLSSRSGPTAAVADPLVALLVRGLPTDLAPEDLLGRVHEASLGLDHRYANGVYYTPDDVAAQVVALVGNAWTTPAIAGGSPPTVLDPAMGGGAFLLAAARALEGRGWSRRAIVEDALWGVDIDPLAVAVAEAAIVLWAAAAGERVARTHLVEGDTLLRGRELLERQGAPASGFDAVVGNPPFQNQLGTSTARDPDMLRRLQDRFGRQVAWRYTDTAALFLLASCELLGPGGEAALVLPQSVLVSGDARQVRAAVLDLGVVDHVWVANEPVFSANVRVCVVAVRRSTSATGDAGPTGDSVVVSRSRTRAFVPAGDVTVSAAALRAAPTWGALVGDLFGAPLVALDDLAGGDTLGSFCAATAGFRDQYYGLLPYVREANHDERRVALDRLASRHDRDPAVADVGDRLGGIALLLTCGLVDPVRCRWGTQPTRFARQRWSAPVVDLAALAGGDEALAAWTADRLVPKLVVSTQTRVIEAAVDTHGDWYPSVPTIALTAPPDRLWHAAAVVMAPAVSAWLLGRHAGAALSDTAIKVSASQLLAVPLPPDADAWDAAIEPLREASSATSASVWRPALERFGARMHEAYGGDDAVLRWWLDRLPPWR